MEVMAVEAALVTKVSAADLAGLPVLHRILRLLNDPAVSAMQLGREVDRLPTLANRLRLKARTLNKIRQTSGEAIALLGNRDFQAVLLGYLEDLTELRADLDEAAQAAENTPLSTKGRPSAGPA